MTAEEYLNQIPMWTRKKNSLVQIRRFLEEMGNPDRSLSVIHVAGTNGKGSVCAYLTSALCEAGYQVGTFTSPHLVDIRERFLLNGVKAEEEEFVRSFNRVKDTWLVLQEKGMHHPTFFEFLFYMAADLFSRNKVDFWVMETGMGGRLDTTNVVEHPLLTAITSISLDHTQYLGNTIREIAGEKAGIIKEGVPVVYAGENQESSAVILEQAAKRHAPAYPVRYGETYELKRDGQGKLILQMKGDEEIHLPFVAPYQGENGGIAWTALKILMERGIIAPEKRSLLRRGMEKASWPGRMEEVLPGVFLDGAHNPGGIQAFIKSASEILSFRQGKAYLLFAAVSDKDYKEMIASLCQGLRPDFAAAVRMHSPRGTGAEELAACFQADGCSAGAFDQVSEALSFLLEKMRGGDCLFCVGSLYLIGEIKEELAVLKPQKAL